MSGSTHRVIVYDGRETAPAGATPEMFLDEAGNPLPFSRAVLSGRATGVPGVVRMLNHAHGGMGGSPGAPCSAMPSGPRATASLSARGSAG